MPNRMPPQKPKERPDLDRRKKELRGYVSFGVMPKAVLELRGEFGHGGGDFRRLFHHGGHHPVGHLGFVADKFGSGQNQGKLVVDIVTQNGKFMVQILNLFDTQLRPAYWAYALNNDGPESAENQAASRPDLYRRCGVIIRTARLPDFSLCASIFQNKCPPQIAAGSLSSTSAVCEPVPSICTRL